MKDNKIDPLIFNEKSLYCLNIRELRVIGRKLGVNSPTSKKKDELVKCILNNVYGTPDKSPKTLFGRHSTHELDIEKRLDKIRKHTNFEDDLKLSKDNNDENFYYDTYNMYSELGFGKVAIQSSNYVTNESIETRTVCEDDGEFYLRKKSFIKGEDDILISAEIINKYNLIRSDIVEIIFVKPYYKIYSINGIKINKNIGKIYVDNKPLTWGKSMDFYLSTKEELNNCITNLIKDCEEKNIKLITFTKNHYAGDGIVNFNYAENEDKSQVYNKLNNFLSRCEAEINAGNNIIVAIEDYDDVFSIISKLESDICDRAKKHFQDITSMVVTIGNAYLKFNIEDNIVY